MPIDYQKGKIYKIVSSNTPNIYIGSTTKEYLSQRLAQHIIEFRRKRLNYSSFEILGAGNYDIILLEDYPCNSKNELHSRERYHIEQNISIAVNKCIPTRTDKEYWLTIREEANRKRSERHNANKDEINELRKNKYNNDEEYRNRLLEQQKQYLEDNKERINQRRRDRYRLKKSLIENNEI